MKNGKLHRSKNILEATRFAVRGFIYMVMREQNVHIQLLVGVIVVFAMILFGVSLVHMAALILAITFVVALEMINTSIELLSDAVHPEQSEFIRNAKDISAGAVLLASLGACIVGVLILSSAILSA